MSNKHVWKISASASVVTAALALTAQASSISVNYDGAPTNALVSSSDTAAGVAPSIYWNNKFASGNINSATLIDDSNTPTTATIFASTYVGTPANNTYVSITGANSTSGNNLMMYGANTVPTTSSAYVNVTAIPTTYTSPSYSVIIYFDPNQSSNLTEEFDLYEGGILSSFGTDGSGNHTVANYTAGGTLLKMYGIDQAGSYYNGTFTQATGDTPADATAGNYVEFTGLTASSFAIVLPTTGGGINGFQIVSAPEPASLGLLAVFGIGSLTRRRRR